MRWLKHTISLLLLLAAVVVALSIGFSDHSDDYGVVPLPAGGTVRLPERTVTVFYEEMGEGANELRKLGVPLAFKVVPAGGGPAVPIRVTGGEESELAVQRSQNLGELGSVAKLDVPAEGPYTVSGSSGRPSDTSSLSFGINPGEALVDRWRLLAGLVGGALLLALVPVPKRSRRWEDETGPSGWSDDPRAPYAG